MYELVQNTATTLRFFASDVNGDPVTGKVDTDWTKRIGKHATAWAALSTTVTEEENGWYSFNLASTDPSLIGILSLTFIATGVKNVNLQYQVTKYADHLTEVAADGITAGSLEVSAISEIQTGLSTLTIANVEAAVLDKGFEAVCLKDHTTVAGTVPARCGFQVDRMAFKHTIDQVTDVLTVFKEDGVTPAWTAQLGTNPAAKPIISITKLT